MILRKRTTVKILSITLLAVILLSLATGCTNNPQGTAEIPQQPEPEVNENVITDMAGREVILPEKTEKIFSLSPVGTIMLYTLCPEKLLGWNYELSEMEKYYILPQYKDLPNLGGAGKNPPNAEEILKLKPDIIVYVTDINETNISTAEQFQNELNIPVVVLDGDIEKTADTYALLGKIIGDEATAENLCAYIKETIQEIQDKAKSISEDKKVRVYYAEGNDGLETDPRGSGHVQVLDMVGGINVAEVSKIEGSGRLKVSLEQLLNWNPDLIIAWADDRGGYYSNIFKDENWSGLNAVKNGEVYEIPNFPFSWFDRPPSVNRILGLKWLGNLLYPEVFDYDIKKEVKYFYEQFYHYQLTEEELAKLVDTSTRRQ
ncbi:ABC-type transporter, periplasmic subunit [Tepidanaerobacter acetatoxydans Re1]|uniref:ABC-type transporter, periplasmic subunit n=1 Tax=Tepidanaerobacter acetatoxydans (strain DSM 21804 / JCM 16047 / Re1) TaxID=1209989 RepID=F4LUQ8_TEPAE|nr:MULTISPECIES: ABC transporter substrate-binding protein [Tepidanaerobacter]AEE90626.1 ABC-type transporter, periplasmic subunit [Tepidanaerobacter acetatoxydans Re1]CCP25149.1 ABC-type transporter, periplasmic subunit [Tepidanaerobacter acetatoxydans Re1]